ncbi:hypothetical protein [Cupriavidus plantarum]|uniref:hypothetical protein n=1 Tax=Cupriavidus plantarum TaxID=942865 RepID=UPI0038B252F1
MVLRVGAADSFTAATFAEDFVAFTGFFADFPDDCVDLVFLEVAASATGAARTASDTSAAVASVFSRAGLKKRKGEKSVRNIVLCDAASGMALV